MKNSPYKLVLIFLLFFTCTELLTAQDKSTYDFEYKISKVLPPLSISRAQLKEANTLVDLNPYYKSSWIRSYHSVSISASLNGQIEESTNKDDNLTQAQKELIAQADMGTAIAVKVKYIPENTLTNNEMKEMNFTFLIDPEVEATYTGGSAQLNQYLTDRGIDKIPNSAIDQYNLAAVRFVVNEEGQIIDTEIAETSKDEALDELLIKTICDMPDWMPAAYADGTRVKQEFVLTVGDHSSCVINLLNIRRLGAE